MPIQETDKKLEAFTDAIVDAAIAQSKTITDELREKQQEMIDRAEAEISAEAERYKNAKIAEIMAREGRRVNSKMTDNKHTLLQYREDCATETFSQVKEKIVRFTSSEDYLPHLKKLLQKAIDALGYGFSAEVYLRREDMHFADELLSAASGVSLAFKEGNFALGGLTVVCPSMGRRVDMSFDAALGDMVGHFSELTGLKLGE